MAPPDRAESRGAATMSDNHGKTPAAWTAVSVMFVGFCIAGIAFIVPQHWLFWVGMGIVVLGAVVGKVMSMMGMGQQQSTTMPRVTEEPLEGTIAAETADRES
jgi:Family of unknown function (DUF6704)